MEWASIHKTPELIHFDQQQALLPSEAVQKAFRDHVNHMPIASKVMRQEVENIARKLVPASSHYFYLIPYYPQIFMILSSLLLRHQENFQGRSHLLLASHEQQYIIDAFTQNKDSSYDWVPIDRLGTISLERLAEALTPRTLLFSLSAANGMTGLVEPIQKIHTLCKERGVLLHLDISDALGRVPISQDMLAADILTFSSLAIGGMGSLGGMFIHPKLSDLLVKWLPSSQPLFPRDLAAMQQACKERYDSLSSLALSAIQTKKLFQQTLKKEISNIQFLFHDHVVKIPNILIFAIPNIPAESLSFFLRQQNIFVSTGLGRFQPLAQILQACGVSPFLCHSAIHLSFIGTISPQIRTRFVHTLNQGVQHLQPAVMSYT